MSENRTPLPGGWASVRLRDVVLPNPTCNPRANGEGTFRYVDIDALDNKRQTIVAPKVVLNSKAPSRARMEIRAGDVIFSLVRPYLKNIAVVPPDLDGEVASTAYCVLRPAQGVESRFLFFQVIQESFIHSIPTYGNSPPAARDEEFLDTLVRIAPASEQCRIVAKIEELFSDLDAGVSALERVQANLKRYRAAVLQAAVTGRLTEGWRAKHSDAEPASELLARILTERRRKWEEEQIARYAASGKEPPKGWQEKYKEPAAPDTSDLPELPKGWCWVCLGQLLARGEYGTSVKCDYGAQGPPVLRIPNIARGQIDLGDVKYATVAMQITGHDGLQPGDLLVCRTNGSISLVGKAALVNTSYQPPHTFASYLLRFRFLESKIIPKWAYTFFTSHQGRRFIEGHAASSAGQHNISLALLQTMPIPLPPLSEQENIVTEVERRLSVIAEVEAQADANRKRAARLRQSILKRAFEGRLVPQDPADEPAGTLLERIKSERADAIIKDGKLSRTRRPRRASTPKDPEE